jgi:hypothetical protein
MAGRLAIGHALFGAACREFGDALGIEDLRTGLEHIAIICLDTSGRIVAQVGFRTKTLARRDRGQQKVYPSLWQSRH